MKNELLNAEEYLKLDSDELKQSIKKLLKENAKKASRVEKIIKQSDKQQFDILKLHEKLEGAYAKIEELHNYDVEQQHYALAKITANIINELSDDEKIMAETIFVPSDIMSGDFYSLFKKPNGSMLFYVVDGQGHGITPSLTVFAVSSIIANYAREDISLQELLDTILPYLKNFLADEEQLSFTIVEIDADFTTLTYSNGGMYPMLLEDGDEVTKLSANTLPMLNFTKDLATKTVELKDFKNLLLYSDGIVEIEDERLLQYAPRKLMEDASLFEKARTEIPTFKRDDDVTLLSISKK